MLEDTTGRVVAVCRNAEPGLPKLIVDEVRLIEDWGVEGDYHAGKFVRHRYLAKKDPTQPNLRQVCIVDAAAFAAMRERNLQIGPGMMGENITVEGVAVMQLAIGTRLSISEALVEVTEVRIPCKQLNGIAAGLLKAVSQRRRGEKVYMAGMMARVLAGGWCTQATRWACWRLLPPRLNDGASISTDRSRYSRARRYGPFPGRR